MLNCYLAPNFDYGDEKLTEYFHKLRCFRMSDSISEEFVAEAYKAEIPKSIAKRDDIIAKFDDGDTALLVVDGMGAEYYPLLLNLAKSSALKVAEKRIVSVCLPSSTKFNKIKWGGNRLQEIKRIDDISHEGYSSHEKCGFEENLTENFRVFTKNILPRINEGLSKCKRVLVTADHGSSYLAINAHKNGLNKTLPWEFGEVDDWRYAVLNSEIETPAGFVSVYSAEENKYYYVVKGYNRLPKQGGKPYAIHGGASLEEVLVPFVLFTDDDVHEAEIAAPVEEFIENDAFDIL
ncbi:MAG: hypothetical protein LIO40_04150 [Ruminococcus sp.]|nr:hypothetical protein [Ruminococcus sp.]